MSTRAFIAVLAVMAVVALLAFGLLNKGGSALQVGDQAPDAPLPQLEGDGIESLADYRGEWVLVNFWASWCAPCRDEAPDLEDFQQRHADEDFTVLGIATRDIASDAEAFVEEYGLTYPQLRDGDGDAAREFGTSGVPENFLVGPGGTIRWLFRGAIDEDFLREEIEPLITGGEPS